MTSAFMSMTWQVALMRRPARVSWTTGVAQAAWKSGLSIRCRGAGLSKSASTPLSTKELYRATVSSRLAGGIGTRWYFMTIFLARSASRLALKKEAGRDVDLRRLRMPSLARDRAFSFLASLLRKGSASSFIPVCDRRTARPDGEHHCGARGRAHLWGGGCQCRAQGKSRAGNDHRQKTPGTRLITPTALGPGTERACTGDLPPRDGG